MIHAARGMVTLLSASADETLADFTTLLLPRPNPAPAAGRTDGRFIIVYPVLHETEFRGAGRGYEEARGTLRCRIMGGVVADTDAARLLCWLARDAILAALEGAGMAVTDGAVTRHFETTASGKYAMMRPSFATDQTWHLLELDLRVRE